MDKEKTILINTMYNGNRGAYSQEGNNIVHEVINLIKADNGNNYLYIVRDGKVNYNRNIGCVLLARQSQFKFTVEIIAKAEGLEVYNQRVDKCNRDGITYGGKKLSEIFSDNTYNGVREDNPICISFRADNIYSPKKRLYLTTDTNIKMDNDKICISYIGKNSSYTKAGKINNQSMKLYVEESSEKNNYDKLCEIVNSEDLWEEYNLLKLDDINLSDNRQCFMSYIGQQYNEIAYSNLFANVFTSYSNEFKEFCEKVLKTEIKDSYSVKREYENIDILIYDEENVIVIENKIHSSINGIDYSTKESQLSKYYNIINSGKKKAHHNSGSKNDSKEIDIGINFSNYKAKRFYIFAPEYEITTLSSFIEKQDLKNGKDYTMISYKSIYDHYINYKDSIKDDVFKEFLLSLVPHTKDNDNDVEKQMMLRIKSKKNN